MSANGSKSARVRAKLNHPIIDTDGHTVEFTPVFFDYIKEVGGAGMIERYKKAVASRSNNRWMELSEEERRYTRATCPPWWARPAKNTLDRATASLPHLLYQRMDELGLDFAVLYPTFGLTEPPRIDEEEVRRACLPRAQHLSYGYLRSLCRPHDARRGHPRPHAAGSHGRIGIRGQNPGLQSRGDFPRASPRAQNIEGASRGWPVKRLSSICWRWIANTTTTRSGPSASS